MKTDTTFDHWDTTPVQVTTKVVKGKERTVPIGKYVPDTYAPEEWNLRREVDTIGDEMWTNAGGSIFDLKSLVI